MPIFVQANRRPVQPATTALDPRPRPLTVLTQNPPFIFGNVVPHAKNLPEPSSLSPGLLAGAIVVLSLSPPSVRSTTATAHILEHF
jgi:hypothetical protein